MPDHTDHDPDEMAEDISPLHAMLLADGADWRAHAPDTTSLSRFLETLPHQRNVDMHDMLPELRPSTPVSPARIVAPRRWSFAVMAALLLIVVLASVVFLRHVPATRPANATTTHPTPTIRSIPTATFSPKTVTAHGITIQLDGVDANALRTVVWYHIVKPIAQHGDEYVANVFLVDDQGQLHHPLFIMSPGSDATAYFTPLAPAMPSAHTITIAIPTVTFIPAEGKSPYPTDFPGPWNFTAQVVPTTSGAKTLSVPAQTVGGITMKLLSVAWINGSNRFDSQGVHFQLAISGINNVADPRHHPLAPLMNAGLEASEGNGLGGTQPGGPQPGADKIGSGTLTLPGGKVFQPLAYFEIANNHKSPQAAVRNFGDIIGADGSAIIDTGFQGVTLTPGETIQFSIAKLGLDDLSAPPVPEGNGWSSYSGPWTFTFTI
jgi:hypothetical protein